MSSLRQAQSEIRRSIVTDSAALNTIGVARSTLYGPGDIQYNPVPTRESQFNPGEIQTTVEQPLGPPEPRGFLDEIEAVIGVLNDNKLLASFLLSIPIGWVASIQEWPPEYCFFFNFLGIIPLAWLIGKSTEDLSAVTGETIGGLLNATFGNVVEMLLCIGGIRQNEIVVTQCTLIGSVLSNLLLVMGTAFLVGGFFYRTQSFSAQGATMQCSLMCLTVFSMCLPTIYVNILKNDAEWEHMVQVSRVSSCLLLFIYFGYLLFQLRTHAHLFQSEGGEEEQPDLGPVSAAILLGVATVMTSFSTDYLIASIRGTVDSWRVSQEFIGIILLPIIGNAAEHYTAITVAARNKMDLSLGVAAGSSCQMGLLVTPFTVLAGWVLDREMTLDFHMFQITVMLLAVLLVSTIISNGTSNWLEGVMLIFAYFFIAMVYFFEGNSPASSLATIG